VSKKTPISEELEPRKWFDVAAQQAAEIGLKTTGRGTLFGNGSLSTHGTLTDHGSLTIIGTLSCYGSLRGLTQRLEGGERAVAAERPGLCQRAVVRKRPERSGNSRLRRRQFFGGTAGSRRPRSI
jgi:hypothetical protein